MILETPKSVQIVAANTKTIAKYTVKFQDNPEAKTHLAILNVFSKLVTPSEVEGEDDVITYIPEGRRELMLWEGEAYTAMGNWTAKQEDAKILALL